MVNLTHILHDYSNASEVIMMIKDTIELYKIKTNHNQAWPMSTILGIIHTGLIFGLHPANERWRYFVTTSLIGWMQVWNQPCLYIYRISI